MIHRPWPLERDFVNFGEIRAGQLRGTKSHSAGARSSNTGVDGLIPGLAKKHWVRSLELRLGISNMLGEVAEQESYVSQYLRQLGPSARLPNEAEGLAREGTSMWDWTVSIAIIHMLTRPVRQHEAFFSLDPKRSWSPGSLRSRSSWLSPTPDPFPDLSIDSVSVILGLVPTLVDVPERYTRALTVDAFIRSVSGRSQDGAPHASVTAKAERTCQTTDNISLQPGRGM